MLLTIEQSRNCAMEIHKMRQEHAKEFITQCDLKTKNSRNSINYVNNSCGKTMVYNYNRILERNILSRL